MSRFFFEVLSIEPTEHNDTVISFRWKQAGYTDVTERIITSTEPKTPEDVEIAIRKHIIYVVQKARADKSFRDRLIALEQQTAGNEHELDI